MSDYKATGKQLEIPPEAKGIPFDRWISKQPLYRPGAIQKWIDDLKAARDKAERKK